MADGFAQTVKQQADIVRILVRSLGDSVWLTKAGAQSYKHLCPFHKEKPPAFNVHASQQVFHYAGCIAGRQFPARPVSCRRMDVSPTAFELLLHLMLKVEFSQVSDPGLLRDHNEDSLGCVLPQTPDEARSRGWLFALADGVGGQQRGEVASSMAVESVLEGFRGAARGDLLSAVLPRLLQAANAKVFEAGMSTGLPGSAMATTLVVCALRFDRAIVAHVGDSRCYLIRKRQVVALTRDHTISNEQLRLGLVSTKEAALSETSHVLSRAVGSNMFLQVDTSEHPVFAGDMLLLCSDGLHHSVAPKDIAEIAGTGSDLDGAARRLVSLAKERDGSDNISLQLIRVRSVERVGMYRGRQYKIYSGNSE